MFINRIFNFLKLQHCLRPKTLTLPVLQYQPKRLKSDLYEPDYLISLEPDEPVYDCLNLQIKGYDFTLLEAYQSQLHKYAEVMGLQVDEWLVMCQLGRLGTLLRIARASLPEGCTLNVHEHTIEHEEIRYVPDNQLIDLKQQLQDMGGSRAESKKKRR